MRGGWHRWLRRCPGSAARSSWLVLLLLVWKHNALRRCRLRCELAVCLSRLLAGFTLLLASGFHQQAQRDPDKSSHEQARSERQTRGQHCDQGSGSSSNGIGPLFECGYDQSKKGKRQRKIQGPTGGNMRAEQQAGGSAYLPGHPEDHARAQKIPVFGRAIPWLLVVDDSHSVGFISEQIRQE